MAFIPGRLFDFIPSMRKRRLEDLERVQAAEYHHARDPVPPPVASTLALTAQQRVTRASAALALAIGSWCVNSGTVRAELLAGALVGTLLIGLLLSDRFERWHRFRAELNSFITVYSQAHFAPRAVLLALAPLLALLVILIADAPQPICYKVVPIGIAGIGLVFVGPWWRVWHRLRFVVWGAVGVCLVLFVGFAIVLSALSALHWLFGDMFAPPLRWVEYWAGE
jgi:hypothetical protein